jgi:hypothetical protein
MALCLILKANNLCWFYEMIIKNYNWKYNRQDLTLYFNCTFPITAKALPLKT